MQNYQECSNASKERVHCPMRSSDIISYGRRSNSLDFLQVYRDGVNPGEVDEGLFDPIPPQKCVKGLGSATFRVGCDDEGNPLPDKV